MLFEKGKYEELFLEIEHYFRIIKERCSEKKFEMTEEFRQVFGEEIFGEDARCAGLNNIDYGFGNIILAEDGMYLIDYEWCFDFPIPIDFILFRALLYFVYSVHENQKLTEQGIFSKFGYSEADITKYTRMETQFQQFVSSGTVSLSALKESMLQRTLHIHELFTGHDNKMQELNGIIEQKENYINEQREWISERDREILKLNGSLEQINQAVAPGTDRQAVLSCLPGFLSKRIIREQFHIYSKMRMGKNEN